MRPAATVWPAFKSPLTPLSRAAVSCTQCTRSTTQLLGKSGNSEHRRASSLRGVRCHTGPRSQASGWSAPLRPPSDSGRLDRVLTGR